MQVKFEGLALQMCEIKMNGGHWSSERSSLGWRKDTESLCSNEPITVSYLLLHFSLQCRVELGRQT